MGEWPRQALIALCGVNWMEEEGAKPAPAKKSKKAAGGDKAKADKAKKDGGGDAAATPAAAKRAQKAAEAKAAKQQGALCVGAPASGMTGGARG